MTLGQKTIFFCGLVFVGFILLIYFISSSLLFSNYHKFEDRMVRLNVERARSAVNEALTGLKASVEDYSKWDDTCTFILKPNEKYIYDNMGSSMFRDQRVNLAIFLDTRRKIVFQKMMDWRTGRERPSPKGFDRYLSPSGPLARLSSVESLVSGVVLLPENPMLVVGVPILTSEGTGPVRGSLIFGRFLDPGEIRRLENATHLKIGIVPEKKTPLSTDVFQPGKEAQPSDTISVMPLNEALIRGNTLYRDILGKPVFLLQVDMPRDIYQQGISSVRVLMLALLLTGLAFGGMILFLLERFILSRLSHLNRDIRNIGVTRNLSMRVALRGNDELTDLARSINGMLEELTGYQDKLRSLASQLSLTEERERRRLAVNLHDSIGQTLALLKIKTGTIWQESSEKAVDMAKEIRELLEQAIRCTRMLTFELSPPLLYEMGFEPAVEWLLEYFHITHGLQITFEKDGTEKFLNDDIRVVLFQAVRELLMNVVKHAQSPRVMVRSEVAGENIRVIVKDEGIGFDFSVACRNGVFGLFSVRERLGMLGGSLDIVSSPGQGTKAVLTAPMGKKRDSVPQSVM